MFQWKLASELNLLADSYTEGHQQEYVTDSERKQSNSKLLDSLN